MNSALPDMLSLGYILCHFSKGDLLDVGQRLMFILSGLICGAGRSIIVHSVCTHSHGVLVDGKLLS